VVGLLSTVQTQAEVIFGNYWEDIRMFSRSEARPSYFDILNKEVACNYHEASFHTNKVRPLWWWRSFGSAERI